MDWVTTAILLVVFVVGVRKDPRRFWLAVVFTLLLGTLILQVLYEVLNWVDYGVGEDAQVYVLLVLLLLLMLLVATLGVFLIWNTFTMRRKEGLGISALLTGTLGLLIVLYLAAGLISVFGDVFNLLVWLLFIGLPAGYLAFLFTAFLLYSLAYNWAVRRFGGPVDAVVVLGSGLAGGERVTPLLAGRIAKGREIYEKSRAAGRDTLLVVSGGRGSDESISEAEAMSNYLVELDFDPSRLVLEDKSSDTQDNLNFTLEKLRELRPDGVEKVAAATNNFHAFRASIIMREVGIPGYVAGAHTARYYWPSAMVREFAAIMLEHSRANLVILVALCLPLVFTAFNALRILMGF